MDQQYRLVRTSSATIHKTQNVTVKSSTVALHIKEVFSAADQTGPEAHPASCTMGTGSFPGVKRPGRGVDHPPPSSAEVKERLVLYLYSLAFVACYRENFTFTFTTIKMETVRSLSLLTTVFITVSRV
jgi:hypothetical protein